MEIPMMDSYLETLAGYICDDDKLVTYKWLSKELEVHVNVAKVILWRYWNNHKNDVLVATFMLIGNLKEGGMRVEVVKECDLETAKEKFEKIISEHVYSLQKTLLDIELLASAGKGDSRYSAITCAKSVVLSQEELSTMRWGKAQAQQIALSEIKGAPHASTEKKGPLNGWTEKKTIENGSADKKGQQQSQSEKNKTPPAKEVQKTGEDGKETDAKSDEKAKKISPPSKSRSGDKKGIPKKPVQSTKAGFGHLFGKAGNQQKPQVATSSTNGTASSSDKKDSRKSPEKETSKSSADALFARGKAKENKDSSNVSMEVDIESPEKSNEKKSSSVTSAKTEKAEKAKTNKKSKPSKSKNRGTKRGRSQESGEETKKRKRIIVESDSSEESAAESADEDMFESPPPPPSPDKHKSPSPPLVQMHGNKRKVRKLVDKTFMDEDGYLITRKEHVYESCSDEEVAEEKPQKKTVVEPKKKVEPERSKEPVKKKQTSIMNFFKKG